MSGWKETVGAALGGRLSPSSEAPVALGLSGGGDSLALLLVARAWTERHGRRLVALTVDHGLNPDSARWTAEAGEAARKVGADWRALAWTGAKPSAGLPAAARAARHRLLAQAARAEGAAVVLLGHTRDDVEEGERMRQADTPGLGRLREWSPSPAWPEGRGVFLLRPMLEVPRAELRAFLMAEGWAWLEDPANADMRFARSRARRALGAPPRSAFADTSPASQGSRMSATSPASAGEVDRRVSAETEGTCDVTTDGRVLLSRRAVTPHRLSAALLCAGGGDTPPRGARLARLLERLEGTGPVTVSLCGARVAARGETVTIGREAGERARGGLAPLVLGPGEAEVWDGRFEVVADLGGVTVGALAGRIGALSRAERAYLKTLPPAARSALPALLLADGTTALPRPFGAGPATARPLVEERLRAACGEVAREP